MRCTGSAYAVYPQLDRSVETLRGMGVHMLHGAGGFEPNEPDESQPEAYPWHLPLNEAQAIAGLRP